MVKSNECRGFWTDFPSSKGDNEVVMYGSTPYNKDAMFARVIDVIKTVGLLKEPKNAEMTPKEYVKKYFPQCKICGNMDDKTRFCVFLYDPKDRTESPAKAMIPLSSLKGFEIEIEKCFSRLFGEKLAVQKLPTKMLRMMEG